MKRLIFIWFTAALLWTACAPRPASLWGVYSTPTARVYAETVPASETLPPAAPSETPTLPPPHTEPVNTATVTPPAPTDPAPTQTLTQAATRDPQEKTLLYYAQSGDTLAAVAARFGVSPQEITSPKNLSASGLIDNGTLLIVPDRIEEETTSSVMLLPDSEVIFSASANKFDIPSFIANSGGFLSHYRQWLTNPGWTSGTDVLEQLSRNNSANPLLLLALLEYNSHWVYGNPENIFREKYPMGFQIQDDDEGLFKQLQWTINQLFDGYYGWRAGTLTTLTFPDGETLRLAPDLNAGTVALQYFFSRQHNRAEWEHILDPNAADGFPALYLKMFGNPWTRSQNVEPIFPPGLTQPVLNLPFEPNTQWNYTSGPHGAWDPAGPLAAVDFAPASDHKGCDPSSLWVVSASAGLVVRSDNGIVVVDLDNDGNEQTGWALLYLHMFEKGRVAAGTFLKPGDKIGHPSCEGGISTGRHLHFARKYNGEWVIANGALPFTLSDWTVHPGEKAYKGTMTNGDQTVIADPFGQNWSVIIRLPE